MVEQEIINLILQYKYLIVFPLAVLEGPAVSIILGFLVSLNYFHFGAALIILVLADLFGDILYYLIGKHAGPVFINRFGKYVGLSFERVSKIQKYILEGIPGIGPKTAEKLIEKYPSIKEIINATESQLKEILGKKTNSFLNHIN